MNEISASGITLARIETPLGWMLAGAVEEGLCLLEFDEGQRIAEQTPALQRYWTGPIELGEHPWLAQLRQELDAYFDGRLRQFSLPLVYPGSDFQVRVWSALLEIPYGETRSYEQLALQLGDVKAIRAVGTANGRNRIAIVIPCHRVINKGGGLGGYGGGLWRKRWLLNLEGHLVGEQPALFA